MSCSLWKGNNTTYYYNMNFEKLKRFRHRHKKYAHVGAAVVILIHSYDKYESGHPYILFVIAGVVFLIIALLHPIIKKKSPWIDGVFFVIEGILSIIVAIEAFHVGKKALPVAYTLLAGFQFYMAIHKSRKATKNHKTIYQ
ncbi:MAG: hypothetical protein ABI266_08475 [Ginsengibacter sp.]